MQEISMNPRQVTRQEYVDYFSKWIMDGERDKSIVEQALSAPQLSGIYNGASMRIRRLIKIAYLRGVRYGIGIVWEAHQPIGLRGDRSRLT